ncbi:MAG: DUF4124 domain-containing protein [Woeseia sp.]|nr:DUF4124 domain-containing protein [Woeseia sp.]MBT8096117.1 DUF4124 domain-containing protein [Woeseia sp.]NNL54101.1 DUF4124 domain-containing protein [Woeseia sp.]
MPARLKPVIKQALYVAALLPVCAFAGDIYKWTDAAGNVHYGDNPAEDVNAERVHIRSRPSDRARKPAASRSRAETATRNAASTANGENQETAQAAGPTPEELREQAKEKAQKCSEFKKRLQSMVQSRRLYREDDNGERVYLDEQEMQTERDKTQSKVEEYCNP